jgi:hypothetical protein
MEQKLKGIAKSYNLDYQEQEATYDLSFDIRNLSMTKIQLSKVDEKFTMHISCNFLWGTSKGPSILSGNTADQYRIQVRMTLPKTPILSKFHIMEHDFIRARIFGKPIRIKCKNKLLSTFLEANEHIVSIYKQCENHAEISPTISSETKNSETKIHINYTSFMLNLDLLINSIDFCLDIVEFEQKHNTIYAP